MLHSGRAPYQEAGERKELRWTPFRNATQGIVCPLAGIRVDVRSGPRIKPIEI
jgi:hypothetical protein